MLKTTSWLGRHPAALAAALAASVGGIGRTAAQLFPSGVFPTPAVSSSVSGDLNGDGREDLVIRKSVDGAVCVFLSDGAAGVVQLAGIPAPTLGLLAVGDLTGDGWPDVVASSVGALQPPPLLHVFAGDGTGALEPPVTTAQPQWIRAAKVLDVDEDGQADLIGLVGSSSPGVVVLLGDGAGGLSPLIHSPSSVSARFQVGDLDEDGHLDVVVSSSGSCCPWVEVLLGDGEGAFASAGQHAQDVHLVWSTLLGDMDGDGHLDVVSTADDADDEAGMVVTLPGDGAGGLGQPVYVPVPQLESGFDEARLFDVESDGDLDAIVRLHLQDALTVLTNDGQGGLAPPQYLLPSGRLMLGSFDVDALTDAWVLFGESSSGGMAIYPGLPGGGFDTVPHYEVPLTFAGDLDAADLDGDGWLDVVRGNKEAAAPASGIAVQLGDGQGGLLPGTFLPVPGRPDYTAVGDLDEDGAPDVVTSNAQSDNLSVLLGDGRGGFGPPTPTSFVGTVNELGLADFDGDGHLDVLAASSASVVLFKGNGAGSITKVSVSTGHPAGGMTEVDLADIDHDGDPDVVGDIDAGVTVWRGNGGTGFQSVVTYPYPGTPQDAVFADVDLDGHQDIVATNLEGTFTVLLGDGAGGFGPPLVQSGGSGQESRSLDVGDVSGDGLPDVVLSRDSQNRVFVLLGDGTGSFSLESAGYVMGDHPWPIAVVDTDGDHRPDVLAGAGWTYTSALRNTAETFTWKQLGHGLAGAVEAPTLTGHGTLATGSTISLSLVNAKPLSAAWLIVSHVNISAPFKGGVLVPFPSIVVVLSTNAAGGFALSATVGPGIPSGFTHYFQAWVADPAGPAGFTASGAISGTTP